MLGSIHIQYIVVGFPNDESLQVCLSFCWAYLVMKLGLLRSMCPIQGHLHLKSWYPDRRFDFIFFYSENNYLYFRSNFTRFEVGEELFYSQHFYKKNFFGKKSIKKKNFSFVLKNVAIQKFIFRLPCFGTIRNNGFSESWRLDLLGMFLMRSTSSKRWLIYTTMYKELMHWVFFVRKEKFELYLKSSYE